MLKLPEKTSEFLTKNKFENKLNNDLGKSVTHSCVVFLALARSLFASVTVSPAVVISAKNF